MTLFKKNQKNMENLKEAIKFFYKFKISYKEFQKYLSQNYPYIDMENDLVKKMKDIATISVKSVFGSIDPNRKDNSFEVLN